MYAVGMADTQGEQFKICKLHNNWEWAQSTQENLWFLRDCYMHNYWGAEQIRACVCRYELWPIRLNCQLMTKLETKHILQAQICDGISTQNEMGN